MQALLTATWTPVCTFDEVPSDRGVAALVGERQIALFRIAGDDSVYALDNVDPFSGIGCLSRGLIGDVAGEPMVVSPLHKQRFSLASGACLEDRSASVDLFDVRVVDGIVELRVTSD